MGPSFILIIATSSERSADGNGLETEHRTGLRRVLRAGVSEAICLFAAPGLTIARSVDGRSFAIGTVFGPSGLPYTDIRPGDPLATSPRATIKEVWGAFLAVNQDPGGSTVHIVRDGSSLFPAYYVQESGFIIVSNDVHLIYAATKKQASIAWDALEHHLLCDVLRLPETCLQNVRELLPGEALSIKPGSVTSELTWQPWEFTRRSEQIHDADEAVALLRGKLEMCIGSWGGLYRHCLLGLSGGLDSSIVAALLARTTSLTGLTLATIAASGDERIFARLVASHASFELHEAIEDASVVNLERSDAAHLPRPLARSFAQWGNGEFLKLAAHMRADAFVNGAGGDNIFCSIRSVSAVADRLLAEGLRAGVATARDLSLMTSCTWWEAYWRGIRRAWFRKRAYTWPLNADFVTADAEGHAALPQRHPWLRATPSDVLPGKSMHIAWIMGVQNHLEGFGRERVLPMISPLMSQPIVEACLRIPSWLWCKDGQDRSMARKAMAPMLPDEIVKRRGKGSPSSIMKAVFSANTATIETMLCDGLLAQRRLLNVDQIRVFLRSETDPPAARFARIMSLVDVEAWARAWSVAASDPPN